MLRELNLLNKIFNIFYSKMIKWFDTVDPEMNIFTKNRSNSKADFKIHHRIFLDSHLFNISSKDKSFHRFHYFYS